MPIRDDDDDDAEKIIYNCSTALSKSRLLKINRIISRNPISLTATIVSSSEAVIREEVRERTKRIRLISEFGLIWRSEEDGMHLDGYFFTLANGRATVEKEVGTRESEGELRKGREKKAGSREGEERRRRKRERRWARVGSGGEKRKK